MDNTIVLKNDLLSKGTFENTHFESDCIVLDDGCTSGTYESPVIDTIKFKDVVASFNSKTDETSSITLKVSLKNGEEFSKWFSYGKWSLNGRDTGSVKNQSDKMARMLVDDIVLKDGVTADGIKYKLELKRDDASNELPKVSLIAFTMIRADIIESEEYVSCDVDLDVPTFSQMVVPEIGDIICSPTTVCMLMNYCGGEFVPEQVAKGARDNGAGIYGNWTYCMAFAGEQGYEAIVQRANSINDAKEYIQKGIPVGVSIKMNQGQVMDGTPYKSTNGHLLLIRGFTVKDGEDYVIVNDPAAPDATTVRRMYKLSQFETTWPGIMYVIKQK